MLAYPNLRTRGTSNAKIEPRTEAARTAAAASSEALLPRRRMGLACLSSRGQFSMP